MDFTYPGALPPLSCLTAPATLTPVMREPSPKSFRSASSSEGMLVGLRQSLKYSFRHRTIDPVEFSISPPTLKIVWMGFPLFFLSHRTVFHNFFSADWMYCSMASSNSFHTCVFVSVTTRAADRLTCWLLLAALGVPQANHAL